MSTVLAPSQSDLPLLGYRGKYYVAAFLADVRDTWGASPWRDEVPDLCLSRALRCFTRDQSADVVDRQRLLVAYCSGEFNLENRGNILFRLLHRLPADADILEKYIRDAATLYSYAPRRWFGESELESSQRWESLYDLADVPAIESQAYEAAKVLGSVVVRPYQVDGKLLFDLHTPDRSRWTADRAQAGGLSRLAYEVETCGKDGKIRTALRSWTSEEFRDYNTQGEPLGEPQTNPYGTIPGVLLTLGRAQFDLLDEQVRQNWALFLSQANAGMNGSPIRIATNMDLENRGLSMGLGEILELNDVPDPSAGLGLAVPSMDFVSPETEAYTSINDWGIERAKVKLSRKGIPFSLLDGSGVPQSGISRVVEREGLNIQRRKDARVMSRFSSLLADLIYRILQTDVRVSGESAQDGEVPLSIPVDSPPSLVVTFGAEPVFQEPEADYSLDFRKTFVDGTMDLAEFARKHLTGYSGEVNPESVAAYIKRNRELLRNAGLVSGTPPPPPVTDPSQDAVPPPEVPTP